MSKYYLCINRNGHYIPVEGVSNDLQEIDNYTRKCYTDKELVNRLFYDRLGSHISYDDTFIIKYRSGKTQKTLNPAFKEKYETHGNKDIYTQLLEFAQSIDSIYMSCSFTKKNSKERIIRPADANNFLSAYRFLNTPSFYRFVQPMFDETNISTTAIDVYNNIIVGENHYNREIYNNFYACLLGGFHRLFYSKDKNDKYLFQYKGFRDFYDEYYNTFIRARETIIPPEIERQMNFMDLPAFKEANTEVREEDFKMPQTRRRR